MINAKEARIKSIEGHKKKIQKAIARVEKAILDATDRGLTSVIIMTGCGDDSEIIPHFEKLGYQCKRDNSLIISWGEQRVKYQNKLPFHFVKSLICNHLYDNRISFFELQCVYCGQVLDIGR